MEISEIHFIDYQEGNRNLGVFDSNKEKQAEIKPQINNKKNNSTSPRGQREFFF